MHDSRPVHYHDALYFYLSPELSFIVLQIFSSVYNSFLGVFVYIVNVDVIYDGWSPSMYHDNLTNVSFLFSKTLLKH